MSELSLIVDFWINLFIIHGSNDISLNRTFLICPNLGDRDFNTFSKNDMMHDGQGDNAESRLI